MSKTVLGVFSSQHQAEEAVKEIRRHGFSESDISIVARDEKTQSGSDRGRGSGSSMDMDVSDGTTTGAALGGVAGLLAGAGALAIPGIGPIIAAGPIAAAISGAVTGGVAGGLLDWGIPEQRGRFYEGKIREGKILAMVKTSDDKAEEVEKAFRKSGASDVESHWSDS